MAADGPRSGSRPSRVTRFREVDSCEDGRRAAGSWGIANAVIDLDDLAVVYPYQGRSFSRSNLRAVWPNYVAVPGVKVILPLVVVDYNDLLELKEITAVARFTVCELTAPRKGLEGRVLEREPDDFWRSRLLDFVAMYHDRDDHEAIRDFQVSTDGKSIEQSTSDVIDGCGWTEAVCGGRARP